MWLIYLVFGIAFSVGVGAYVSRDVDIATDDRARVQQSEIQGQNVNVVSRSLRRLFLADPTIFPPVPNTGQVVVPADIVRAATPDGMLIPPAVVFLLDSSGAIVPILDHTRGFDKRNPALTDTFNTVLEEDGVAPHLYGRMRVVEREGEVRVITLPSGNLPGAGIAPPGYVRPIGDSDSGYTPAQGDETTGGPGLGMNYPVVDIEVQFPPGDGGETPSDPGTPGDPDVPVPEPENEFEQIDNLPPAEEEGEETPPNDESTLPFIIDETGMMVVSEGFVSARGPRGVVLGPGETEAFYAGILAAVAAEEFAASDYLTRLSFEGESEEALNRNIAEVAFENSFEAVLVQVATDFEARIEAGAVAIGTTYGLNNLEEVFEEIAATVLVAASYGESVMKGREAGKPVRANMGSTTNYAALRESHALIQAIRLEMPFLAESIDPDIAQINQILVGVETLWDVVSRYPAIAP